MLVFSMLLSLSVTAFAVEKPAVDHDGMTIFVGDVRVEKKDTKNSVEIDAVITAGSDYTTVRGGTLNFDIDSTTTGINDTDTLEYATAGKSDVRMISADEGLTATGKGAVSFAQGKVNPLTVKLTLPNVIATTKINVTGSGMYVAPPASGKEIDSSKIKVVSGSVIVQYPVTVNIATDSDTNAGFAISTTTTAYNKATYDMAGKDTTTLTTGGTFYVDSGEGQQNRPVLNFIVPENYYAEVTVNNGAKQTVGTSSFALPEVTKDTTVSVKLVAGQVPSDEYTKTSMSYQYGNYDLAAQDTKRFDKKGTDNTVAIKNFDGYKLVKYQINNDAAVTENLGTPVTVDITKDNSIVFTYERKDNSTVVPGPDGAIGGGDDVTITPVDKTQPTITPDETGAVTLPADKQGVVSDDKGNTVVVPGGTKVDKEGKIYLPGVTEPVTPENPKPEGNAFYLVTYKYENTVLFTQLGKTDETVQAMDYPSSAEKPGGKEFKNWNTQNAGNGQTYEKEANINGELTLYAQWKDATVDPGALNSAKITYYSNESTSAQTKEEVRRDKVDTTFPGALDVNAFAAPGEGWTLAGWLRKGDRSNKIYGASENVTLSKGEEWTLYAQWIKEESGAITVPGKDGIPESPDDATAKPGNQGGTLSRDDKTGIITIPAGGSVTVEGKEYPMPDGGTLKPNGEISINQPNNGGSIVVKPDGGTEVVKPDGDKDPNKNAFTVTYESGEAKQPAKVVVATDSAQIAKGEAMFSFSGHKFAYWKDGDVIKAEGDTLTTATTLTAYWYTVDENGGVVIKPDPDKEPDKEIIVKPNPDGSKPTPGEDGSVEVKPGGSIEVKPKEPNGGVIELPDGGKVNPDGTITIPGVDGKIDPNDPTNWPENILMVKYNANGGTGEMASQLGKNSITVKKNLFTQNDGFQFNIWNTEANGSGTSYKEGDSVVYVQRGQVTTLYAMWYKQNTDGSIVHPGPDGKPGGGDDITIKPNPNPGDPAKKPEVQPDGSVKVPDGGEIVIPGANTPTDDKTVTVTPGATVKPDGSIVIPEGGSATIQPEGTTVTGPTTLKPDALPKPPAANPDPSKPYKPGNGTIVLPGADGSTEAPKDKDNVIVKPDTGTIDPGNNNVTTKGDNTTIEYPKAPNGNGAIIKVPEGTVIKPDGSIDMLPNPGGTIVLPDGTEITVPGGSKVDPDGTITIPDGGKGEITPPGGDKTEIPGGSTIDKDGNIVLPDGGVMSPDGKYKYTVVLKSSNGTALTVNGYESIHWVKKDTPKTVVAPAVTGYLITGESSVVVTGGQKVNGGYTITFTYTQNSGGTIIVTPSNPSKPSNPNKPSDPSDTNRPASPSVTGVSKMLESENHIAYMGGYGNGMFGPNDQMTRAQVAQMFYNLLKDKNIAITVNFSDVQGSDWYATAVNTLASLGIIRGVGDGIFDPNRSITRAEFATIALRFADKTAGGTNPFTDVASNDWYYSAVLNAVGFGWITGYSDGTFRPNASITRAEVATIVNRMLDRNADHDFVNGNATASFVDVPSNHWAYYNIMEATTPHTHTVDRNGNESWGKLQ